MSIPLPRSTRGDGQSQIPAPSHSGIPTRSRLPQPTIRPQRSLASLAAPTPSVPSTRDTPQRTSAAPPRTPSRLSSTTNARSVPSAVRTQRSLGSLRPPPPKAQAPHSPNSKSAIVTGTRSRLASKTDAVASPRGKQTEQSKTSPPSTPMSLKDQIALRRAEAKKAQQKSKASSGFSAVGDDSHWTKPVQKPEDAQDDLLGRPTVRQMVEKARTSGSLNLMSRQLPALPSILFSIHLGVEPKPLKSQSDGSSSPEKSSSAVAWYEGQDLTVLKAGDNEITELQEEIGLFGSLKSIDLQKNPLSHLPVEFSDLTFLTHLDLSACKFETIPVSLATLPALTLLNLSQNSLISLSFALSQDFARPAPSDPFYAPSSRSKADRPFPSLQTFLAHNNKLTADSIDTTALPDALQRIDLSHNRLGNGISILLTKLSSLAHVKRVRMRACEITDAALTPVSAALEAAAEVFPRLEAIDFGDNEGMTEACVRTNLLRNRDVLLVPDIDQSAGRAGAEGNEAVCLAVGKIIQKEPWEIEAEQRTRLRNHASSPRQSDDAGDNMFGLGFGSKSSPQTSRIVPKGPSPPPVVKEQWELDAEEGLNTVAGRLRAQHAEAEAASSASQPKPSSISFDKYYKASHATLSLPPSLPAARRNFGHGRTFSLATKNSSDGADDPAVPPHTLPLSFIRSQPWSVTLRVLHLTNRRADTSILLPRGGLTLDRLEELLLDGCNLSDSVRVLEVENDDAVISATPPIESERREALIPMLSQMFPSLALLDLSYNQVTTLDGIDKLFFPPGRSDSGEGGSGSPARGLKVLRVRGNKINETGLSSLVKLGEQFLSGKDVERWRGEEIDLRENDIAKLPPQLGLLRLDILLVEGNGFRVPNRRVWERDGTKGLLTWLKDTL